MQKIARLIGAACPENTPQGIERRAIPENRIALFRQQAVLRMEFGAEQRGNRPLTTFGKTDDERHADPGAQFIVDFRIAVGMITGHVTAEKPFDGRGQLPGLTQIGVRLRRLHTDFPAQCSSRQQRVVIERRGGQIGPADRETPFQFVGIRRHDSVGGPVATAILQTPFD